MSTHRISTSRWSLPASSWPPAWYWDGKCPRASGKRWSGRQLGSRVEVSWDAAVLEHLGLSGIWCRGLLLAPRGKQGEHHTCITAPRYRPGTIPVAQAKGGVAGLRYFIYPALFLGNKASSKCLVLVLGMSACPKGFCPGLRPTVCSECPVSCGTVHGHGL